ncbi:MAG: hypothetical protein K1X57_07015 [Gemmataceae bacterium]|nr:hypothetical protein [Gemmataceae bacterium]
MNRRPVRRAHASFDMVLCTAALLPIAAGLYAIVKSCLAGYFQILGATIGWPLM